MINPFADVDWSPDRTARRRFGRSLVIGFPIVAALWLVAAWVGRGAWPLVPAAWVAGVGVGAGLLFVALPGIALPFYLVWYGVACSIGLVVSNTVLLLSYYAVLVPIGLGRRLLGRRSLERTIDRQAATYWRRAPPPPDPSRYMRQF